MRSWHWTSYNYGIVKSNVACRRLLQHLVGLLVMCNVIYPGTTLYTSGTQRLSECYCHIVLGMVCAVHPPLYHETVLENPTWKQSSSFCRPHTYPLDRHCLRGLTRHDFKWFSSYIFLTAGMHRGGLLLQTFLCVAPQHGPMGYHFECLSSILLWFDMFRPATHVQHSMTIAVSEWRVKPVCPKAAHEGHRWKKVACT